MKYAFLALAMFGYVWGGIEFSADNPFDGGVTIVLSSALQIAFYKITDMEEDTHDKN